MHLGRPVRRVVRGLHTNRLDCGAGESNRTSAENHQGQGCELLSELERVSGFGEDS